MLRRELDDGQGLDRVDPEIGQVSNAIQYVQKLGPAWGTMIAAVRVDTVERGDVKLIDDQVVE